MGIYVLGFQEIDQTQVAVVGGKGAHLGELSRTSAVRVPAGFCVTTDAFRRIMAESPSLDARLERLSRLQADDREAIRALSAEVRRTIEGLAMPDELVAAITQSLARLGEDAAYAVRSSATAEDLPTASFAATRAAREAACHEEVRLNRRLAPDVYLGVGDLLGPDHNPCEHVVMMRRMPADRCLTRCVVEGEDVDMDDDHFADKVQLLSREAVPVVSFTFGCPAAADVQRLQAAGSAVWVTVTDPSEAESAQAAGADARLRHGRDPARHRASERRCDHHRAHRQPRQRSAQRQRVRARRE